MALWQESQACGVPQNAKHRLVDCMLLMIKMLASRSLYTYIYVPLYTTIFPRDLLYKVRQDFFISSTKPRRELH